MRLKINADQPLGQQPCVLTRGHTPTGTSTIEQELSGLLALCFDVVVDGLSGRLSEFEPNGPPGLSLTHGRSVGRISVGGNVIDLDGDEVTATKCCRWQD